MKVIRILLLLLVASAATGQPLERYTKAMHSGNRYLYKKKYDSAVKFYQDALIAARECPSCIQLKKTDTLPQDKIKLVYEEQKNELKGQVIRADKQAKIAKEQTKNAKEQKKIADNRTKEAEEETRKGEILALLGASYLKVYKEDDLTKGFQYAKYAYYKDSGNAEISAHLIDVYLKMLKKIYALQYAAKNENGDMFTTISYDTVSILDSTNGKVIKRMVIPGSHGKNVFFSPSRKTVFSWLSRIESVPSMTITGEDTMRFVELPSNIVIRDVATESILDTIKTEKYPDFKAIDFFPDEQKIIMPVIDINGMYGTYVYDVTSKKIVDSLHGIQSFGPIYAIDSRRVLTIASDSLVKIWDLGKKELPPIIVSEKKVTRDNMYFDEEPIVFSKDRKKAVIKYCDSSVSIFDIATNKIGRLINPDTNDKVICADFSPDGEKVFTISNDSTAKIWNIENNAPPLVLKERGLKFSGGAFSGDSKQLLITAKNKIIVWDVLTGMQLTVFQEGNRRIGKVVVSGQRILAKSYDSLYVFNNFSDNHFKCEKIEADINANKNEVLYKHRLVISNDSVLVVDTASFKTKHVIIFPDANYVRLTSENEAVLSSDKNGVVLYWNIDSGAATKIGYYSSDGSFRSNFTYAPDHNTGIRYFALAKYAFIINTKEWEKRDTLFRSSNINFISYLNDSKKILFIKNDECRILNIASGKTITAFTDNAMTNNISYVITSDSGNVIVIKLKSGECKIWNIIKGTSLSIKGLNNPECLSKDGSKLLTSKPQKGAVIWNTATGDSLSYIVDFEQNARSFFSKNGDRVINLATHQKLTIKGIIEVDEKRIYNNNTGMLVYLLSNDQEDYKMQKEGTFYTGTKVNDKGSVEISYSVLESENDIIQYLEGKIEDLSIEEKKKYHIPEKKKNSN